MRLSEEIVQCQIDFEGGPTGPYSLNVRLGSFAARVRALEDEIEALRSALADAQTEQQMYCNENAALRRDNERIEFAARETNKANGRRIASLEAEIERMKPVYEAEVNRMVRDLLMAHRDDPDGIWLYLDERDREHGQAKAWVVIDEISTGDEFVAAVREARKTDAS